MCNIYYIKNYILYKKLYIFKVIVTNINFFIESLGQFLEELS